MVALSCVTRRALWVSWRNASHFSSLAIPTFEEDTGRPLPLHPSRSRENNDSDDARWDTNRIEAALDFLKRGTKPQSVQTYICISLQC
eukprot:c5950_g1_i1 orf=1-261(-)